MACVPVCVPQASQGDVGQAVGLLTSQPPEVQDPGDPQESKSADETWKAQKGTRGTEPGSNLLLESFLKTQRQVFDLTGLIID